ncbi:MAG: acyltransferase [Tannerella sp.]|jgi:fucose 4-O-acetylase-like acetyltransferase|nr:acyltransferase [Tannerella sp.]
MKTDIEQRQSIVIESMRFPLILLVLYNHMLPVTGQRIELNLSGWNCYHFISEMISHNLAAFNITFYFLISGYFFVHRMSRWEGGIYYKKIKKRTKSLLMPYLVWIVLLMGIIWMKSTLMNVIRTGGDTDFLELKNLSLFQIIWGYPLLHSFWFLRDLMCMTLLTPLFYYFCKYTKVFGILALMVIYLGAFEPGVPGFSMTAIFFYATGVYLGMNKINILELCGRYKWPSVIAAFCFLIFATFFTGSPHHIHLMRMLALILMVACVNIFDTLIRSQRIKNILLRLSVTTFFVYAIHQIYIINWLKGALARSSLSESPAGMIIAYFLIPCICAAICIGIYSLLRKLSPALISLLCGGRMQPVVPVKSNKTT